MNLELAVRLTEILLGLTFLQQSAEHLRGSKNEQYLFLPRALLSIFLVFNIQAPWVCLALVVLGVLALVRFNGPYNGGADRMSLLVLCCLTLVYFMPTLAAQEGAFGYLAVQLVLSYFISGWVKIVNPEWRSGRALQDVFSFSAYPVAESLRGWAKRPRLLRVMSWSVMLFELLFPLSLLTQTTLIIALAIAAVFHLANACLFGLNRFLWVWLAAYPSILWLQHRIFGG